MVFINNSHLGGPAGYRNLYVMWGDLSTWEHAGYLNGNRKRSVLGRGFRVGSSPTYLFDLSFVKPCGETEYQLGIYLNKTEEDLRNELLLSCEKNHRICFGVAEKSYH